MARADRAFALLVLLAAVSGAVLLGVLWALLPRADALLERGAESPADLVAALIVVLATCGVALGLGSLFRQLHLTASLIRGMLSNRIDTPERVLRAARGLGIGERIDVVLDDRPFSFCYWFLRPRICLSAGLVDRLDRGELRAVLLHERYHLRHRDPLRLVLARYFAAGLYVVPVLDELVSYYALQKEVAADQEAVRASGGVRPLARALYKVLPDADAWSLGLLVPVGSLSVAEARIEQLVGGRPVPLPLTVRSVAVSSGTLLAAMILAMGQVPQLQPVLAAPGLLAAPASLLFAAAVSGALHQIRLVAAR